MKKNNIKWIMVTLLFLCFIALLILVIMGKTKTFDETVYSWISKCMKPKMTIFAKIVTESAGIILVIALTIVVTIILLFCIKNKKVALLFAINPCFVALINFAIKNIIRRPRPDGLRLIIEGGYSFPSGHTAMTIALYGYIAYLINRKIKQRWPKICIAIIFLALMIMVAISRIYLGVHYASDIIAAALLSTCYIVIYIDISDRIIKGRESKSIQY